MNCRGSSRTSSTPTLQPSRSRPVWNSNSRGAPPPLLNHGLYAIDATPARRRGFVGSSPLDGRHPTHRLICAQVSTDDVNTSIEENESSQSLPELDDEAPFELRALEAVLRTCTLRLDAACEEVEPVAEETMRELQTARQVALASLERLRHVKNAVSHLEARTRDTAEALEAILDEDEDMCMMRLSLLRERPRLFDPPISPELLTQHEDVELLLESYLQDAEAVQTRLELIRLRIDNAEDLFGMKLDLARNRLITADTIFTLLGMVVGAGAMVGGFFGMNLHQEKSSFVIVCVVTASALMLSTAFVFWYLVRSGTLVLA